MLFSKKGRQLALMTACLLACQACSAETAAQGTPEKAELTNYGSWQPVWLAKLQRLSRGGNVKFRIVQLGAPACSSSGATAASAGCIPIPYPASAMPKCCTTAAAGRC